MYCYRLGYHDGNLTGWLETKNYVCAIECVTLLFSCPDYFSNRIIIMCSMWVSVSVYSPLKLLICKLLPRQTMFVELPPLVVSFWDWMPC